ncbi:MAG: fibronectin type III domain-containing protein [Oscillospiraceae bacterium]|nr:fibronectin type III domain-containing protein [Oscillospiraceae bacterium]
MELSEPMLVSPLLDGFVLGEPISDHHGVRCCPAIRQGTNERYIVKIISIPASQVRLDALLLTGACSNEEQALAYFKELADGVIGETDILKQLSQLEGFLPYTGLQIRQMEDGIGYDVYLISPYKQALDKLMATQPLTHLSAVNLGLDLCAALTVCRRAGYLYADLKPSNIFLTETQGYRIGDLGFIPMASLKFASLPEKYRSSYTAPEITDAMSSLNTGMDIYALGLVLYQAYNNGQLPFDGAAPAVELPTPMYADYEMAEIILKACAPDPADRWQDPAQMGQALVDYMQRNSINDTPIIPAPVVIDDPQEEPEETFLSEEENTEELAELLAMIPDEVEPAQLSMEPGEEASLEVTEEVAPEAPSAPAEDDWIDSDQLTFLGADAASDGLHATGVTNEVAQMLAQADDLIAHELPEPVVAPAPIEVAVPPLVTDEPEMDEEITEEIPVILPEPEADAEETDDASAEDEEEIPYDEDDTYAESPKKGHRWIAAAIAAVVLILIGIGAYVWYDNYYIQRVYAFEVQYQAGQIHVAVNADIDNSLLTVVCTDTYGNTKRCPVTNGTAVFGDLNPSTQYRLRLEISGFHKLEGPTSGVYTTQEQTSIVDFTAICGPEDGSVILNFSVSGPECDSWIIAYSAAGEAERTQEFTGHMVTIYDLTPGAEYTFRFVPPEDKTFSGNTELTYTAQNILYAEDLTITACGNGSLTVSWQAPAEMTGKQWVVRCYDHAGYDKSVTTSETTVTFTDLDQSNGYTIIVTAEGMTQSASTSVSAAPVTVTDYTATVIDPWTMDLTWEFSGTAPAGGWILLCSVNGGEANRINCPEAKAQITLAPGSTYVFTAIAAGETDSFGESFTYGPVEVAGFEGFGVTAANMTLSSVLRPDKANWNYKNLKQEDYKTTFTSGENISLVAHLSTTYATSNTPVDITYVVHQSNGSAVSIDSQSIAWRSMWYQRYCELDLPVVPTQAGDYTVDLYFSGMYVGSVSFTIT